MSCLQRLRTLAETNARPHATPKRDLPTLLERAIAKKAARDADRRRLVAWAGKVKARDRWRDRRTGVRVHRSRELDPLRAEAHHIASREDPAVRYDVRNGITLSLATHEAVERNLITIVGTRWFTKAGTRYINGNAPVTFRAT